jgi:hypothetical protein
MKKDNRYVCSAIEDLAFTNRSSRVTIGNVPKGGHSINIILRKQFGDIGCPQMGRPHIVGEYVLSTRILKGGRSRQTREQRLMYRIMNKCVELRSRREGQCQGLTPVLDFQGPVIANVSPAFK